MTCQIWLQSRSSKFPDYTTFLEYFLRLTGLLTSFLHVIWIAYFDVHYVLIFLHSVWWWCSLTQKSPTVERSIIGPRRVTCLFLHLWCIMSPAILHTRLLRNLESVNLQYNKQVDSAIEFTSITKSFKKPQHEQETTSFCLTNICLPLTG